MRWSPERYGQYAGERATPFFDLVAHVPEVAPRRVVDLGCGPGTLTIALAERWPEAEVVGLDSSPEMLEQAAALPDAPDNLRFERADITSWQPGNTDDVVITNAALQWVPEHRALLRRWFGALPAGATLAVQVPGSATSASHGLLRELVASDRWRPLLGALESDIDASFDGVGDPADYLEDALSAGWRAEAWETTYLHLLSGADPVLDWVRGTRLRPVLTALDAVEAAAFEAEYARLLRVAYPAGPHGTPYPFRRVFLVATKPDGREAAE